MIDSLKELLEIKIDRPGEELFKSAKKAWDGISKPIDGLGDFETVVCRLAAIEGKLVPDIEKRCLVVMCADNGIIEEGVSQSGKDITKAVAAALGSGISSACSIARSVKADVRPVDIGIDCDEKIDGVLDLKVSKGTRNFLKSPAMEPWEVLKAISAGIDVAKSLSREGYDVIVTGEMGIGNTTTSAAVLTALLKRSGTDFVGRGAGLSDEGLSRKKEVIRKALDIYDFDKYEDDRERTFEILRTLGGLDIAALAGVFIGGALCRKPVVIDGVISSTAALVANALIPGANKYMIPSHKGRESGNEAALSALGLEALIAGNMALGEGTGALMLFPLLDVTLDYYRNGASFSDYSIENYKRFD